MTGAYVEDMYESWAHDPKSVHPSWDSYFRNGGYQVSAERRPRNFRSSFLTQNAPIAFQRLNTNNLKIRDHTDIKTNLCVQAPPGLGASTRPNEVPLSSLMPSLGAGMARGADSHMVEARLAVQGAIR